MLKGQFQNFLINRICQIPLMLLQGVIILNNFKRACMPDKMPKINYVKRIMERKMLMVLKTFGVSHNKIAETDMID